MHAVDKNLMSLLTGGGISSGTGLFEEIANYSTSSSEDDDDDDKLVNLGDSEDEEDDEMSLIRTL